MERPDAYGLRAHDERVAEFANEMAREYVLGHAAVQSARYVAAQKGYMQAMTDREWAEFSKEPLHKDSSVSG